MKFPTQSNREFLRRSREFESKNRELFEPPVVQIDFRMMFFGMEKAVSWPFIAAALAGFEPEDRLAITAGWNAAAQHQLCGAKTRDGYA